MISESLSSAIPIPVRNHLISGKWYLKRLPSALIYYSLLAQKAPLDKQIEFLPAPTQPLIYWTELKNIGLHGSLSYPPSGRLCMDGNWDVESVYPLASIFDSMPEGAKKWDVHETIRLMFYFGKPYTATPQYEAMVEAVEQNSPNPPQGCYTMQDVDQYFMRLAAAFKSMQKNGYLTQKEQGKSSVGEIRVHITRGGKLCLGTGGNHRIRMAELLGIRWVPFLLRGVHPNWVKHLCQLHAMPPHIVLYQWLNSQFYVEKPNL